MKKKLLFVKYIAMRICIFAIVSKADAQEAVTLDNENIKLPVDMKTTAISSFLVKNAIKSTKKK